MERYYCHKCSVDQGYLIKGCAEHINFTGNTYKLEKFIKHTVPKNQSGLLSFYSDSSYEAYKDYSINTLASGSTMFDINNKKNIIFFAGKDIGLTFLNGVLQGTANVVKVVLSNRESRIHSFPVDSSNLIIQNCERCGANVLTGHT